MVAGVSEPPHALMAEQAVLGALLYDNDNVDKVEAIIISDDFYNPSHRLIYQAIQTLIGINQAADIVSVSEALNRSGQLDSIGGLSYLGGLVENTPSITNIQTYAEIVRDRAILRGLIRTGNTIAEMGAHPPPQRTAVSLVEDAERQVFALGDKRLLQGSMLTPIGEIVPEVFEHLEQLIEAQSPITGIPTGFADLDDKLAGLHKGDLVVIAGRPSMGKTALTMNIVETVAIKSKLSVAVFSMEMSASQLIMRMLSSLGRINQHNVRTGNLNDDDWTRLTSQLGLMTETKIFIDDTTALTPSKLHSRCRRLKREHGLGLVVVDYMQLMQTSGNRENRTTEMGEISRNLKILAKEMNVPVIATSQLNRALEQRSDKRPQMSDLRESGSIEQDADAILFIYRDEVYNENSDDKGKAEIIISKQRNGPVGTIYLTFLSHLTRFENFVANDWGNPFSG